MLNDLFQSVYDPLPCGIMLLDSKGCVLRTNRRFAELTAPGGAILAGAPARDLYADPAAFDALLAAGPADGPPAATLRLAAGDGAGAPILLTHAVSPQGEGSAFGQAGFLISVMAQPAADPSVENALHDVRSFFDQATEGMYRSSLDGRMLRANPALVRLNGYETEAELLAAVGDIGAEWYVDPGRRAEFRALLNEEGQVENFESEIYRHHTRERLWISENARLVRPAVGAAYYEGTVRDISQRKKVEERLRAAMREAENSNLAKSEFLANISHELRTPLNAIIGFSEMILSGTFGSLANQRYASYLKDINDSAALLLQLIEDILDVSKAEAGKLKLDEGPVDLAQLIRQSHHALAERASKTQVALKVELPGELPAVRGDERRLRQVVTNLLSNAVKFTPPGGQVLVRLGLAADAGLQIIIRDTGSGIPEDDLARIFEPFVQLEGIMQRSRDGAGLGLPLCKSLVQAHGGTLKLRSAPGQGTEVEVSLPPERVIRTASFARLVSITP